MSLIFTLAVISDLHSNLNAYNAVLSHLEENFQEITEILCPGDLVGYGPHPQTIIEAVLSNEKITAVTKGNHDHAIGGGGRDIANIESYVANFNPYAQLAIKWQVEILSTELKTFLYQLPHTRTCLHQSFTNKQIGLIHGSPNFPLDEYILPNTPAQKSLFPFMELIDLKVLIMGHTHIPFIDKSIIESSSEVLLMLNPGSVGQPRDKDPRASYAVIDLEEMSAEIIRVDYDIEATYQELLIVGLPEFLGERLKSGK
ncbi:MAG: metallophosphoesterase family protein [Candidatus Hodarchaeales archaeon]